MPMVCPDPAAISAWRAAMAILTVAMFVAAPLALITLWRAPLMGAIALLSSVVSTILVVVTGAASAFLFMRLQDTITQITAFFPRYPSSCVTADELYGHFSPPPGFFEAVQRSIDQVAPLETAAAVDAAVAAMAIVAVLACALIWGRRRPSKLLTA